MDSQDEHPTNSINECTICYDPLNIITDIEITPCMHMFHTTCYREWLQRASTCPLCRSSLQRKYINHQREYIHLDLFRDVFHPPPIHDINNSTTWRRIRVIPFVSHFNDPEERSSQGGMRIGEMEHDNLFDEPTGAPLDRDLLSTLSGGDSTSSRLDHSRLYNEPGVARAVLRNEIRQVRVDYTSRSRIFNPEEQSEFPMSRLISNDLPTIEPLVETFQVHYRQHTNFASEMFQVPLERFGREDDYLVVNQPVVQPPRRNRSTKQTHYHHIRQARNQFRQYARR